MKNFLAFLKSKTFFKHLAIALTLLVIVLWLLFRLLAVYTNHGETVEVPDFKNQKIGALKNFVKDKGVTYLIIDSIYDPKEKAGIVIRQDPEPKSHVKHNRIIYLYVTSTQAPQIVMPKLVDRSLRQAVLMIESYGLKVGRISTVSGECNGCVLKQLSKGKLIEPGAPIKKGTVIELVVGKKEHGTLVSVPDVRGLTLREAIDRIASNSLNVGARVFDKPAKDSLSMFVYRQVPGPQSASGVGGSVDLYLTSDKEKAKTSSDGNKDDDDEIDFDK